MEVAYYPKKGEAEGSRFIKDKDSPRSCHLLSIRSLTYSKCALGATMHQEHWLAQAVRRPRVLVKKQRENPALKFLSVVGVNLVKGVPLVTPSSLHLWVLSQSIS